MNSQVKLTIFDMKKWNEIYFIFFFCNGPKRQKTKLMHTISLILMKEVFRLFFFYQEIFLTFPQRNLVCNLWNEFCITKLTTCTWLPRRHRVTFAGVSRIVGEATITIEAFATNFTVCAHCVVQTVDTNSTALVSVVVEHDLVELAGARMSVAITFWKRPSSTFTSVRERCDRCASHVLFSGIKLLGLFSNDELLMDTAMRARGYPVRYLHARELIKTVGHWGFVLRCHTESYVNSNP